MNKSIKKYFGHVRLGDEVILLSGNSRGKSGKIIAVDRKHGRVKVSGIALCMRHKKANNTGEKSQIFVKERFISASSVKKIVSG